jgi:hypothetical protein
VAATVRRRGLLGCRHGPVGLAVVAAFPLEFARQAVGLYRDPALWQSLRENALTRIREENGRAAYERAVRQVLEA